MLVATVLLTLAAAPLGLLARREPRPLIGWGLALLPLGLFALFCAQIPAITAGGRIDEAIPWVPGMGIELRFALDGLSLLFALIISGIGVLIIGYAGHYMEKDAGLGRFYLYLVLFMGSMLGLVLAGNVLTMFVFWELTSITSYLLIGYKHEYPDARRGAQQSLLVTAGGGLALLLGLLLLGAAAQAAGAPLAEAYTFQGIIANGEAIKQSPLYAPALMLVFLGAFTKSAQFPFHFWLPGAMQAPTPASAYLHSATMVKAGVYLLARLAPGLGDTPLWSITLVLVGGFTFAFGGIVAFRQYDIKALLAYTTLSMLGGLVLLIGLGGKYGAEALTANILAHALYKSALFMSAGIIDHESGTRDLNRLGGLRTLMPRTMVIVALALLSQMGIPIMLGFVAKEWMLKAALESSLPAPWPTVALALIIAGAVGYIIAAWRLFKNAFLGEPHPDMRQRHVHDPPTGMVIPPILPAGLSLILPLGLLPAVSALLVPAAVAVYGEPFTFELYLYEGVNLALLLSLGVIIGGAALATQERRLATTPGLPGWLNGAMLFDKLIDGMLAGVTSFTRVIQGGKMRVYIACSLLALVAAVGPSLLLYGLADLPAASFAGITAYELIAALLIPVGILATIFARSRLGAIVAVGIVGAMVAFLFVIYSAPDLALTQLLIEVLSTVFLMLVFAVLPVRFSEFSSKTARLRDAVFAGVVGVLMAGVTYAAASSTLFPHISSVFKEESLPAGQGANVVNVIIVDFRGFDTMGEITVLFIALLGIYAMLRLRPGARPTLADSARPPAAVPPAPPQPTPDLKPVKGRAEEEIEEPVTRG